MKAVVFAYHTIGTIGLEALKREGFTIEAIFSHSDDPNENCWFSSVTEWAKRNQVKIHCPENVNQPKWIAEIKKMAPDIIFSFYYRHLIGVDILRIPSSGAYNLHGSLLPAYRGRCPVNWVLINGETRTGVTLHHMVKEADAGDIVGQKEIPIDYDDTALTLYKKLCQSAQALLEEILPLINKGIAPRKKQDLTQGSYFGGRRPEDGKINWNWPALQVFNLIRAVTEPYPGAFAYLPDGERLFIWWGVPEKQAGQHFPPGSLEVINPHVYVWASEGRLRLMDIETGKGRLKDEIIFEYFKDKAGIILK